MRKWFFLILLLPQWAMAQVQWDSANSLYAAAEYQAALDAYTELQEQGADDAALYFNAGCAAFKLKMIPEAVWNFEMALYRNPGDEDARYNLEMANALTVDKLDVPAENIISGFVEDGLFSKKPSAWYGLGVGFLWLALAGWLIYLFTNLRKLGFYAMLVAVILALFLFFTGYVAAQRLANNRHAILFVPSVYVKSGPGENQTDLFILHEGTKVRLLDSPASGWQRITIGDDKTGWIKTEELREIR